ncbi:hypothetical protein N7517_003848 [Penicillium concentricum]|uniref:Uncharacterized protein n=1 Tax=Penicillium concentricum TaxID=293559 RepID=A0A9W9S4G0_9EURO|nr:uncharacterized protein N7517_003848 [Penicillium concentricum]KAJ5371842.1 hypothetical protein N7517_003848 [Penicillium concentricum]
MESANPQFIQDRVDEIENDHVPRDVIRQVRETENVSRLEDMKTILHGHMDGVIPSTLVTDERRHTLDWTGLGG